MKCIVEDCNNERANTKRGSYLLCWKHRSQKLRRDNPATYYLNMLRQSAARRGIKFSLTVDQFKDFCGRTGFLKKRGQGPKDMTIDRKDPMQGYEINNIQMIEHRLNSSLGGKHRKNKNPF